MTINDEIEIIIESKLEEQPAPQQVHIRNVYEDGHHVDVEIDETGQLLKYVWCIGNDLQVDRLGIVFYLDNDFQNPIIISR